MKSYPIIILDKDKFPWVFKWLESIGLNPLEINDIKLKMEVTK